MRGDNSNIGFSERVKADKINGVCRKCYGSNLYWHDGSLGYEAIVCADCGTHHTDENPIERA